MFPLTLDNPNKALVASLEDDNWLWHHKYGHMNSLCLLSKYNLVDGLLALRHVDIVCQSCKVGKQRRLFPKNKGMRASRPTALIHANLCRTMCTSSLTSNLYFVVFVNDLS